MAPRPYSLKRRAETAEETRRRILEATLALHAERGVLATSHRDIATRADVSVGSVYHHFPTVDAIVRGCGARVRAMVPVPAADEIDTHLPRRKRVAELARLLAGLWARMPWAEKLQTERHLVPALDAGLTMRDEAIRRLIRRALGPRASAKRVAIVEAILGAAVVNRLLESGISSEEAGATLASMINAWLEGGTK